MEHRGTQASEGHADRAGTFRVRPLIAALLIYLAVGLPVVWSGLFGGQVLSAAGFWTRTGPFPTALRDQVPPDMELLSDSAVDFVPWLRYAADAHERDGRIPLWKDTALCGAPFVGNGQSAVFYPTVLAAIALGAPPWIHAAQALAKLVGGALCAWLLGRHLGLSFLAALLCGLIFGFGGFQAIWLLFPLTNVSLLLPLLLLAADRVALQPSLRNVSLLSLVAGMQQLGGHPETAFHCQTVALVCALLRSVSLRGQQERRGPWKRIGAVLAGLVLGAGIGAVQVLPLLEYISQSDMLLERRQAPDFPALTQPLMSGLFVVALAAALIAFRYLATARRHLWLPALVLFAAVGGGLTAGMQANLYSSYVQILAADWFGNIRRYLGPANYLEHNGAFAGAALPLVMLGLFHGKPRGPVKVLGVLLGIGLLLGFHAPVVNDLLQALPVFGLAANLRLQFLSLLACAVLAGCGLDALGRVARTGPARQRLALAVVVPALAAIGAIAVSLSAGLLDSPDVPIRPGDMPGVKVQLLTTRLGAVLYPHLPEPTPCEERPLSLGEGRLFSGLIAAPKPVSGVRLVYGRDSASVYARSMPLDDAWFANQPLPASPGVTYHVFHAIVAPDELLPEQAQVRVWVRFQDGSLGLSDLLTAPDDPGPEWLPYPARPAPGLAEGQLWLLASATLLAVLLLHAGGWWRRAARIGLVVLVGAGLLAFVADKLPELPPAMFYPSSPALRTLKKLWPDGRMITLDSYSFGPEIATYYGIPDVRGYDVLYPRRVAAMLRAATDPPAADPQAGSEAAPEPPRKGPDLGLLGLMSVKLLSAYSGEPGSLAEQRFRLDDDPCSDAYILATNPEFLPRARLVGGAVVETDDDRALALLRDPAFARGRTVVLASGEARAAPDRDAGNATIVLSRPEQVRVQVAPTGPGWLVLADTFFPGWTVLVDGQERELLRANVAFRAVAVAPGDHLVEFRYEPLWYRVGAVVSSLVGLTVLWILIALPLWRRARE